MGKVGDPSTWVSNFLEGYWSCSVSSRVGKINNPKFGYLSLWSNQGKGKALGTSNRENLIQESDYKSTGRAGRAIGRRRSDTQRSVCAGTLNLHLLWSGEMPLQMILLGISLFYHLHSSSSYCHNMGARAESISLPSPYDLHSPSLTGSLTVGILGTKFTEQHIEW
jgi:hypothetical protein